jgi:hypothetical protein
MADQPRGMCRNGFMHYCPNCDNSFRAADPPASAPPPEGEGPGAALPCKDAQWRDFACAGSTLPREGWCRNCLLNTVAEAQATLGQQQAALREIRKELNSLRAKHQRGKEE